MYRLLFAGSLRQTRISKCRDVGVTIFRPSLGPSRSCKGGGGKRAHARSHDSAARERRWERCEWETPSVGITPATDWLGAISFHRRPQPLIYRQHRELIRRVTTRQSPQSASDSRDLVQSTADVRASTFTAATVVTPQLWVFPYPSVRLHSLAPPPVKCHRPTVWDSTPRAPPCPYRRPPSADWISWGMDDWTRYETHRYYFISTLFFGFET